MSDLKNAMDEIEKTRSVLNDVDKEELEQLRAEKEQANKHSLQEEIERLRVKLISADEEMEEVDTLREHLAFSRVEKEEATNHAINYKTRLST